MLKMKYVDEISVEESHLKIYFYNHGFSDKMESPDIERSVDYLSSPREKRDPGRTPSENVNDEELPGMDFYSQNSASLSIHRTPCIQRKLHRKLSA